MSEHKEFNPQRVAICYDVLSETGIIAPDAEMNYDEKVGLAEQVILNIHATVEGAEAPNESERRTRIKKALGFRSYLLPYFENAPADQLRSVMRECGWSIGQNVDTVAKKGLKFYSKMAQLPQRSDYELSIEAQADAETFRGRPKIEIDEDAFVDLDDTVRQLGMSGRLNAKYAQGLLVAYAKAHSTYDPLVVATTVSLALEDVLRRHKFHFGETETVVRRFSEAYLYGLHESLAEPDFERLCKHSWQMAAMDFLDDETVLPKLESTVARQLTVMYPEAKK